MLDFSPLKLVNSSRSTYGLRSSDYARYKSHCSAKLHHLRQSVNLLQVTGKQKKYTKKEVTVSNATTDRHLQILLYSSERAWADAGLIKSKLLSAATSTPERHRLPKRLLRAKHHSQTLLSIVRALSSAESSAFASTTALAETTAYHLTMAGSLAFEKADYAQGLRSLSVAHSLLSLIASTASTAVHEALANEMIDDLEPMIRFCAYKLDHHVAQGVTGIILEITESEAADVVEGWVELTERLRDISKERTTEKENVDIDWRGERISVRNAELVKVVLQVKAVTAAIEADDLAFRSRKVVHSGWSKGKARASEEGNAKVRDVMGPSRMAIYDKAMITLTEAEEVSRKLVEDSKIASSRSQSARSDASTLSLALAHSYIVYQLLTLRIRRDLLMVESSTAALASRSVKLVQRDLDARSRPLTSESRAHDPHQLQAALKRHQAKVFPGVVRLYDGVILGLEQLQELEIVEKDAELSTAVEARIAFIRAARCLYLSRSYALLSNQATSLSLLSRATLYLRQSRSIAASLSDVDPTLDETSTSASATSTDFIVDLLPLSTSAFEVLELEITQDEHVAGADWGKRSAGALSGRAKRSLTDAFDGLAVEDGDAGGMDAQKVAKRKKVVVYDIAFSYVASIDMDALARRAQGVLEGGIARSIGMEVNSKEPGEEEHEAEREERIEVEEKVVKKGWGFGLFSRG